MLEGCVETELMVMTPFLKARHCSMLRLQGTYNFRYEEAQT